MLDALKVLIVEDNPGDARFIQILLRSASSRLSWENVESVAAATAALDCGRFDLCLLDLTLPDASGAEGVRILRARFPDLPLVIMTGHDDDDRALEIVREGAQDYLIKGQADGRALLRSLRHAVERQKLEQDLRESRAMAERANKAKSVFLANMSHELRTPLNAILGFSQIMEEELMGPLGNKKYAEYARDIRCSGEHLLGLINDVLDLAKVEAGKLQLAVAPTDLSDIIQGVVHMLAGKASSAELSLEVDAPDSLPLNADTRALKQCLFNLIGNSIKFCRQGGAINVRAGIEGDRVRLVVADSGIGIAPDALARLTRPFEQAHSDWVVPERGTGLGLALTKDLVELHGGSLGIESEEGRGTTVTVLLPLAGPGATA